VIRLAFLLFITFCLSVGYAYAGEQWTREDKTLASMLTTALVIDWAQTRNLSASGHFELNPILGRQPSTARINTYFLFTAFAGYLILDATPNRTLWLKALTALEVGVISHNYYIGVRANF
jgi:hypothetical protein